MNEPLLLTKLAIQPLRPNLVPRLQLLEQLDAGLWGDEGFARKLTLISAGAGYGKTTLLNAWIHALASQPPRSQPAVAVVWLSLDEADNDPVRFLSYLIAALQQVQPEVGAPAQALLGSPRLPPPQAFLSALINELAAIRAPFVLALDDYHVIHNQAIHQHLAFLLEHQPAHMHVALAAREDPPLPLARWRARGQVVEIRQADLRFNPEESAGFLQQVMGLSLSAGQVAALDRRTEGWITGLQLAALSLQGRDAADTGAFVQAFSGSHRFVLDYLIEEVFSRQPPAVQTFLLRTSLLERLSAPLCDAVLAGVAAAPSRQILAHLEQSHLFVLPMDPAHTWYRYHRLFADLLRHQLQLQDPDAGRQVHARASAWYAEHGFTSDAIEHALAGSAWPVAARLIHEAAGGLLRRGEVRTLLGRLERLPDEITAAQPQLCLDYAWSLQLAGQLDASERWLARAEQGAAAGDRPPDLPMPQFLGQVAAARADLARSQGDMRRAVELSHRALALLPAGDLLTRGLVAIDLGLAYWHAGYMAEAERALREAYRAAQGTGNDYARLTAEIFLARISAVRGELIQAAAALRPLVQDGPRFPSPIVVAAYLDLGALHYEWDELDAAGDYLRQASVLAERFGHGEFEVAALLLHARLHTGRGEHAEALEAINAAVRRSLSGDVSGQAPSRCAAAGVEAALAQGDRAAADRWAAQAGGEADAHPFYRFLGLTTARMLLARGEKQAAAALLATCAARAAQAGWVYGLIATRVLQALAAGSDAAAQDSLAGALTRGRPGRFLRVFVDAGPGLAPLLHTAARRGVLPAYAGEILAVLEGGGRRLDGVAFPPEATLVEPLTRREMDVLRLLASGLSNAAIADALVVSQGTVKTHVHHICAKLDATNRTQAVARARQFRLL